MSSVLRTPDERFLDLPGYPFAPHYLTIDGYRIHFIDEGPRDGKPILLLHGEPSWSYLYRKMIPVLRDAGHRVIAPDLLGFGKSDKPTDRSAYSHSGHVKIISTLVRQLDLDGITLFCQDWGGLIGLRVVAEMPGRFARIVAGNTGLPFLPAPMAAIAYRLFRWAVARGARKATLPSLDTVLAGKTAAKAFFNWVVYTQSTANLPIGEIVGRGTVAGLTPAEAAAYDAPFPDERYKAGARVFPMLVPSELAANHRAWRRVLSKWTKPFLTTFSDSDPISRGTERVFWKKVPGAKGQPHVTIKAAGHFLQEDKGEELASVILAFMGRTAIPESSSSRA